MSTQRRKSPITVYLDADQERRIDAMRAEGIEMGQLLRDAVDKVIFTSRERELRQRKRQREERRKLEASLGDRLAAFKAERAARRRARLDAPSKREDV